MHMIRTTETIKRPRAALPRAAIAKPVSPELVPVFRGFCDWLALSRRCAEPACQRDRACAGDPVQCFDRFYGASCETARLWMRTGAVALMNGCTRREATREADAQLLAQLKTMMRLPLSRAQQGRAVLK
jgi:hypothetical protein